MAIQWNNTHWKKSFFTIWTGQSLSLVGSTVARFALIWWLTAETGSATVLAMATLFSMLPQIVLGPFAGVFVDRWNRRITLIVADSAIALVSLWLGYLFWSGDIQVWHVYAIMLVRELGGIFHWPAMQSSTSLMVPKEHLARVSGLNQAMMGVLNIVGPALGAVLLELVDIYHIMLMDVATAAFAVIPLIVILIPQPEAPETDPDTPAAPRSMWTDLRAGLDYLVNWRGLMMLTGMIMLVKIALTPAFSLIPLLVKDHFNGGASDLAGLEAAFGVGVIAGGLLLGVWGGFKRNMHTSLLGVFLIGAAMAALGLLPGSAYVLALGVLLVMGISVAFTDGPLMAVMQGTVAPEMQGRVFMLFGSLLTVTSPIGLAIAGPVTDWVGIQVWYITAGFMLLIMGVWASFTPAVINLEDYQHTPTTEQPETPTEPTSEEAFARGAVQAQGAD